MRILPLSCILLAAASAACGSNVVREAASGAGGATSTSATSTGATSTGASSTSAAASSTASSSSAASSSAASTGSASSSGTGGSGPCPVLSPNDGDPCTSPGLVCPVAMCCGGTATCEGSTWKVVTNLCGHVCPPPCPGTNLVCEIDALCVDNPVGGGPTIPQPHYNCARNPCMGAPLSCSCAGSLCIVGPCSQTSGNVVTCTTLAG
jgi:hypothetical protein